ncbi:MAG: DNA translocase FtsK 4TM domain-containing protein [Bacillota bacterium]|jgi:S-DNA-T family DNA segregation ATPase FtsK/SpoIIIE|nr:DNA translocase FtsK [Clostridia bacterium]
MPKSALMKEEIKHEILGISLIALAILLLISFYLVPINKTGDPRQMGTIGFFAVRILAGVFGMGRFVIPFIMMALGLLLLRNKPFTFIKQKLLGMIFLFFCIITFLHFYVEVETFNHFIQSGLKGEGGGLIGAVICWLMQKGFGVIGAKILLGALSIVSIVLITDVSLISITKKMTAGIIKVFHRLKIFLDSFLFEEIDEREDKLRKKRAKKSSRKEAREGPVIIANDYNVDESGNWEEHLSVNPIPQPLEIMPFEPIASTPKEKDLTQKNKAKTGEASSYILPSLEILQSVVKIKSPRMNKDITESIRVLEETLESFGVKVKVTQVSCGPAVTRFEMQPCPGVKVSKIVNLADDIALNLAAPVVRIEAPVPGKSVIGIEVPKKEVSTVCFREVLETPQFLQSSSKLTVALGKDITGNPVVADLAAMPHLLIAGATGSGKSVCINTLICSILYKAKPSEVKFLMIDPKMVEMANYNGLPHLISPVVTDPKRAAGALKWIVNEMENRYNIFASTGVKDLYRYNELKQNTGEELPQMVVLIDELSDLMMVAPNDVEDSICRLAQMARAAGIHLVVATQRPSVDVITGLIKANIPSRIAFAVSSQIDSRTILDMAGAEKLLGKGDMLFNPIGAAKPIRVQGVYIAEEDINNIVSHCCSQAKPEYLEGILKGEFSGEDKSMEKDVLFDDAAKLVITTGQASVSLLQRRLRVGYSRAARLMDMLENQGIVGEYEGSKPRNVLVTLEQFERMQEKNS